MKIVTHSGNFHADDVFAVATLKLVYTDVEIVRSRDTEVIKSGDIVVDAGGVFDPSIGRFDHHQRGGAGVRENGIPYAAFGLIWREHGQKLCGDAHIASLIEEEIVIPIDAIDNGISISKPIYPEVYEYNITDAINSFLPDSDEIGPDATFPEAVDFAQGLLSRLIENAKTEARHKEELVRLAKRNAGDPVLVLDKFLRGKDVLIDFPGILYVVFPGRLAQGENMWYVKGVMKDTNSFDTKKPLPSAWGGLSGKALIDITGVEDAIFCHKGRFLASATSKEGAIKLARLALNS